MQFCTNIFLIFIYYYTRFGRKAFSLDPHCDLVELWLCITENTIQLILRKLEKNIKK